VTYLDSYYDVENFSSCIYMLNIVVVSNRI